MADRKPELLAPAGSTDSFHAALEAGADAVYLGLDTFNARLRARNFTAKTLSFLVPFAHRRGAKVYVTLNTVVKQGELRQLISALNILEQIGVDAIIVQDLGVIEIARRWFPTLAIHASTQMAIHNSAGARTARDMGVRRVILARELTLDEIATVARKGKVETEVFVHGALCYSISGLCLASSFLGGQSGNRGRCTQVCRRRFSAGNESGFYFSCNDFQALDHLDDLKAAGVASLKIEGRMKRAEYVYTVVSGYRMALDNPGRAADVKNLLLTDFGRAKTTFFLGSLDPQDALNPLAPSGTGIALGSIEPAGRNRVFVQTDVTIAKGDRIRLHGTDGLEGRAGSIKSVERASDRLVLELASDINPRAGDLLYLTARKKRAQAIPGSKKAIDTPPVRYRESCNKASGILREFRKSHAECNPRRQRSQCYLRVDSVEWLNLLAHTRCDGIILAAEPAVLRRMLREQRHLAHHAPRLIIALPPFIAENEMNTWRTVIRHLRSAGIRRWMCGNIGQKELIPADAAELWSDTFIWSLNRASQTRLRRNGFDTQVLSLEDDILNIRAICSPETALVLFGTVPLFISRIRPSVPSATQLSDLNNTRFFTATRYGLHYLLAQQPLCLTHRRSVLAEAGIEKFILDFSFLPPDKRLLHSVVGHYKKQQRMGGSSFLNHKRGLK